MKKCSKCAEEKPLSEFHKKKDGKYGVGSRCKSCIKAYSKTYYEANREKIKSYQKTHYKVNKDKINSKRKTYIKTYNEVNKERLKAKRKAYREANKDKIKVRNKAYREANKEKIKEINKAYREANKDKINARIKAYREANRDKERARQKAYREANREEINNRKNKRRKTDYLFKLRENISSLIRNSINKKGYTKKSKTYKILGCTYKEFKKHIERQFTKGMTWDNYGKWHLDHIYPVAKAKDEEELLRLNHYTNFQPLWAKDNISKKDKIPEGK
jgi:hypothetical protein